MSNQQTSTNSKWSIAFAAVLLICAPQVWAQTLGDYRSIATGNWSSNSTWQSYNGSAWVAATSYPGQSATAPIVTIQTPHTITLNINPPLIVADQLIINAGASLVDSPASPSYTLWTQARLDVYGNLNFTNTLTATSGVQSNFIFIYAGALFSVHTIRIDRFVSNSGTATVTTDVINLLPISTTLPFPTGTWINQPGGTFNFLGAAITAGLHANFFNNTVNYASANTNQTVRIPASSYFSLTISGNGGRTKTLPASTVVLETVAVQGNSNFSLGGFDLFVGGDWNYSSSGNFIAAANTTVTLNGSSQQNIINTGNSSGTIFSNFTINNDFATSPQINVQATTWVDRTLTMLQGNINLNGNSFNHGPVAGSLTTLVHSGLASAGWIYGGPYRRTFQNGATIADGSISGMFPVGTSQYFRPIYISSPTVAINNQAPTVTVSSASNVTDVTIPDTGGPIVRQHQGAWQILSLIGATGAYNINAGGFGFLYIGDVNDLRLSLASSVVGGAGVNSGTTTIPFVQRTGLTPAQLGNTFYLGSVNKTRSPLPVELIAFNGEAEGGAVNLNWITRTELNCDYFTVYRSRNGIDFLPLGTKKGVGTTKEQRSYEIQDQNPWQGINYYRLEQTDFDGTKSSVAMISVEANGAEAIQFYPSHLISGQNIHLQLQGLAPQAQMEIYLVNATGQTIEQYIINTDQEGRFYGDIRIGDISAGFYYLKLNQIIMKILIN
ncbi:MAG: hypothetical protein HYZ44_16800 [Bacteroidetes bacterium]|nr:hypothetical protein [Bacteroidota bacterium]